MLKIERVLKNAGGTFFDKYHLMKERLLNVEYEHWAAGFAKGNNHGRGHITRVLENLDRLLGSDPLQHLIGVYELFLAMMSILYHDIGLLRKRKGHAELSKALLEGDVNNAYIIDGRDKEIIEAAVVSHSSSNDIAVECSRFLPVMNIGGHSARPTVIAALVRLADELDEDYRRADPILQKRLKVPAESRFFWRFCQRVSSVSPNLVAKCIYLDLALEPKDTMAYGRVSGGKTRHFVAFVAEKLAKINKERVIVNRFLPAGLQYTGLHVNVMPLSNHSTWTVPRTFVFNDSTNAEMFLGSFPELLEQPAKKAMIAILEHMRQGNLDKALQKLDRLDSVAADLSVELQLHISFDKACTYSLKAGHLAQDSKERTEALDESVKCLFRWFEQGQNGGWGAIGRTVDAEVHRMATDPDLALVRKTRRKVLQQTIPFTRRRENRGGAGDSFCVPRGTLIETPQGKRPVENLLPGDALISLRLAEKVRPVRATIAAIATSRKARCLRLNQSWLVTPTQPVRSPTKWVEAHSIRLGDWIMDGQGMLIRINEIETVEDYFEVFDLVTDDPSHNYIANGLLVHNKLPMDIILGRERY
jgi:hypothetical protein